MKLKLTTEVIVASTTLFSWIGVGTIVFHRLEDWNWIQSFYFSVVTITTVGYGDFTPTNDACRLFTALYILIGVSVGLVTLSLIGAKILEVREERFLARRNKEERGG